MNWLKENLVSIVSIFISACTAIFLGIIVHFQNKKIAKLNGQIERGNYVHKVQFEKEFLVYEEVLELLNSLIENIYILTNCIRWMEDDSKIISEHFIDNINNFQNSSADFTKFYEKFLYLYSEELYKKFQSIDEHCKRFLSNTINLSRDIILRKFQFDNLNEYFDESSLNIHKEMENTRKNIIHLIKERLENLKIVD